MSDKEQQRRSRPWEIFGETRRERRDPIWEADQEYRRSVEEGRWPRKGGKR